MEGHLLTTPWPCVGFWARFWSMENFGFHRELDFIGQIHFWVGHDGLKLGTRRTVLVLSCVSVCWVLPEALTSGGTPAEYPLVLCRFLGRILDDG